MPAPTSRFDPLSPYVLRPDGPDSGWLLAGPRAIVRADTLAGIGPALAEARRLSQQGLTLAGGLAYEAVAAFHPRLPPPAAGPLLWFGAFDAGRQVRLSALAEGLARPRLGPLGPEVDAGWYAAAVGRVLALIAAGDIYQANLTFQATLPFLGASLALFLELWARTRAPEAMLVHCGDQHWLSLSPELFFALSEDGTLTARPMKGTAPRHPDPAADVAAARSLQADPKNRAENLMIVDLLRHDMAKVTQAGSVAVPRLFTPEVHPYVHQLTSTITGQLLPGIDALAVLEAMFPCGSVTGAPKQRAMEVIAEVESGPRGLYCGAIGIIGPGAGAARFAVPIRTLVVDGNSRIARLGLGSGLVADSEADAEWAECLAKARFLDRRAPEALVETMRREPDGRLPLLSWHLARLSASAAHFGFLFPVAEIEAALAACPLPAGPERVRLLLGRAGEWALQRGPAPAPPPGPVALSLAPHPLAPGDWRLAHKSLSRDFWVTARAGRSDFDTLFHRPDGQLTEGSFNSLFVRQGAVLLTPPLAMGLLPGVLRADLLARGEAREAPLRVQDALAASVAGTLFVGNALRGLLPAEIVQ